MHETMAREVFPLQLAVLSAEAGVSMTGADHPPDKYGNTITVSANGVEWRLFKSYQEAQNFLAGAVSGARLRNDKASDVSGERHDH